MLKPLADQSLQASKKAQTLAQIELKRAEDVYQRDSGTLNDLIAEQNIVYKRVQSLYDNGTASSSELSSAYSGLSQLQQQLDGLKENIAQQRLAYLQSIQSNSQNSISLKNDQLSLGSGLDQVNLQIQQSLQITAPIDGSVASLSTSVGQYVNPGDPMMTLMPSQGRMRAIVLAEASQVKRIKPGDKVLVSPSESPAIRFGYIEGYVRGIAETAATQSELIKLFGSSDTAQSLLQQFSQGGAEDLPVLIKVDFTYTPNNQVQWTLRRQPPWGLSPGGSATAKIIVENVKPISLIFPFLKGL